MWIQIINLFSPKLLLLKWLHEIQWCYYCKQKHILSYPSLYVLPHSSYNLNTILILQTSTSFVSYIYSQFFINTRGMPRCCKSLTMLQEMQCYYRNPTLSCMRPRHYRKDNLVAGNQDATRMKLRKLLLTKNDGCSLLNPWLTYTWIRLQSNGLTMITILQPL